MSLSANPTPSAEDVLGELRSMMASEFGLAPEDVEPGAHLVDDLDLDSIDLVDLAVTLEDRSGIKLDEDEIKSVRTVADAVNVIHAAFTPEERRQRMNGLRGLFAGAYPFAIVAGIHWLGPRFAALLYVPVLVNLGLLVVFGRTLWRGPPLIETLARLQEPELCEAQRQHCRSFTRVWCLFFAINALVCLALAIGGDLLLWTLYTGVLAYVLMALVFAVEWMVRSWRFHQVRLPWADPLLRRLYPEGPMA